MAPALIFLVIVLVVIAIAVGFYLEHKRREFWRTLAKRYGLRYSHGDPFALTDAHQFALFEQGHSKKVSNTLDGRLDGMGIILFDYQYTVGSGKHRQTYYYSGLMVDLPVHSAYLHIRPENFWDRIAAAFGFDDIDFEYDKFNRAFKVTGDDKKFAYDICHAAMMEYLLERPELCWEIRGRKLLLYSSSLGRFDEHEVEHCLSAARGFIDQLPSYLLRQ